jgi:hypothetical protein
LLSTSILGRYWSSLYDQMCSAATGLLNENKRSSIGPQITEILDTRYMDSFLEKFNTGQVRAIGYADDGALIVVCHELATARKLMQPALNKAYYWAYGQGLTFSAANTTALIFSDNESQFSIPLHLGEDEIMVKDTAVYLGVTFERSLSWDPHILRKVTEAKKHLMRLRQAVGGNWGPPHYGLRRRGKGS